MSVGIGSFAQDLAEICSWLTALGVHTGGGYHTYPAEELSTKLNTLVTRLWDNPHNWDAASVKQIVNEARLAISDVGLRARHGKVSVDGNQINAIVSPLRFLLNRVEKETTKHGLDNLSGEAMALALLVDHGDWSDAQIAAAIGVNRTTLYDWERFTAARAVMKQASKPPRGRKDRETGTIEADSE